MFDNGMPSVSYWILSADTCYMGVFTWNFWRKIILLIMKMLVLLQLYSISCLLVDVGISFLNWRMVPYPVVPSALNQTLLYSMYIPTVLARLEHPSLKKFTSNWGCLNLLRFWCMCFSLPREIK